VSTRTVSASTTATVGATYNAVSRNATLTVNTASGGGGTLAAPSLVAPASDARFSPGQTIAFDWSDVTGAVSYTIQIDDQSTFTSPLVVQQVVTTSQFSSSTLPTQRMWWRVRANDASGNPGAWSAARRFEVKN